MDEDFRAAQDAITRFEAADAAGLATIEARRRSWPAAKEVLFATLNGLLKGAPNSRRGLYVSSGELFENFDGVQLAFGSVSTGILRRTQTRRSLGVERGPTLVFGQSESGLVAVQRYPAETTLPDERRTSADAEFVESIEPSTIAPVLVLRIVKEFFEWAPTVVLAGSTAGKKRPIGFSPGVSPAGGEPATG